MSDVKAELRKALITTLRADAPLMAVVQSVTDASPAVAQPGSEVAYPLVTVGELFASEFETKSTVGFRMLARIHTWSQTGSLLECDTIQGLIFGLLHNTPPAVTGHNLYLLQRESSNSMREHDTGVIHGVCEYRALIHQT